jgi:hypothetical protein
MPPRDLDEVSEMVNYCSEMEMGFKINHSSFLIKFEEIRNFKHSICNKNLIFCPKFDFSAKKSNFGQNSIFEL